MPILQQEEIVGHAVRAGYLYSGVADVAALTGHLDLVREYQAKLAENHAHAVEFGEDLVS